MNFSLYLDYGYSADEIEEMLCDGNLLWRRFVRFGVKEFCCE